MKHTVHGNYEQGGEGGHDAIGEVVLCKEERHVADADQTEGLEEGGDEMVLHSAAEDYLGVGRPSVGTDGCGFGLYLVLCAPANS